jgi:uncharacterized protein (DUF1697 family)
LREALAACPFDPPEGRQVHGFFCWSAPRIDASLYESLRAPTEELAVRGDLLWLYAPDGVGRSKLAEKIGKVAGGTAMTARNLNTIRALAEMLD